MRITYILKRFGRAVCISWVYALTLGLLFAACTSGSISPKTILLPGVIPVMLIVSSISAVLVSPLVGWSLKPGKLVSCGIPLWFLLALYVLCATPRNVAIGFYGVLLLSVLGLVIVGLIRK